MSGRFHRLSGMPPIKALMTPFPHSIPAEAPIVEAQRMMARHGIRHLPVKENDALVGVITEHEVEKALEPGRSGPPRAVREISVEAHVADLLTPADRVLQTMAERRLEAVLVVKDGRLAGIFTVTDACSGFSDLLRKLFPGGTGEVA